MPVIVWIYSDDEKDFIDIMFTQIASTERFDNILMEEKYFITSNKFIFSNTCFVNQLFIKFQVWKPFNKVGSLTEIGINYNEEHFKQIEPLPIEKYIL